MKTLIVILTLILTLTLFNSCNYAIKKYRVDPETGKQKLVAYNEYSYNMTPEIIEADYNSDMMKGVAEQVRPHSKKDASKNVYMSETAALVAMEIGGRYYQSKGYGRKWVSSRDGTVTGSVTNDYTAPTRSYKKIPGTISRYGKYYLVEDVNKKHPLNEDEARLCAKYTKYKKNYMATWR